MFNSRNVGRPITCYIDSILVIDRLFPSVFRDVIVERGHEVKRCAV